MLGTVSVSITDERDLPVPDASLRLSGPTSASATTDLGGNASLGELQPGSYQLTATKSDFTDNVSDLTVTAGDNAVSLVLLTPIDWGLFAFNMNVAKEGEPSSSAPSAATSSTPDDDSSSGGSHG
jgi:hypothetical protein